MKVVNTHMWLILIKLYVLRNIQQIEFSKVKSRNKHILATVLLLRYYHLRFFTVQETEIEELSVLAKLT